MESFSAEWLALREPADHAARAHEVTSELANRLARRGGGHVIDIGCGTGSNVRYLLPRLPAMTRWTLVDRDATLLDTARRTLGPRVEATGALLETIALDLTDLDALPLRDCALVTASALLDLVSAEWLQRLAARCRDARAHVLAALNYDGRLWCDPPDPDDEWIRALVNTHQRTDKGFGPALGPTATAEAEAAFGDAEVLVSTSDWTLRADAAALQRPLVDGWASAARAVAPAQAARVEQWRARRLAHVDAGGSSMVVGHLDLAVFPDAGAGC
jgi:SAM-dependent methyltransferase